MEPRLSFRWAFSAPGPPPGSSCSDCASWPGVSVTRMASGHRRNAEAFARAFAIPGVAADAEDLAGCTDVDAVYIGKSDAGRGDGAGPR